MAIKVHMVVAVEKLVGFEVVGNILFDLALISRVKIETKETHPSWIERNVLFQWKSYNS